MTRAPLDRREMLRVSVIAATLASSVARARENPTSEQIDLWPDLPPGAPTRLPAETIVERPPIGGMPDRYVTGVARPRLEVFRPDKPDGRALLVMPGGAYLRVVLDKEGRETATRMTREGITVFVLTYRLPMDGWAAGADAPLQDAQRAMRLIRAKARHLGIDPKRVSVLGFSAGGQLAASLSVRYNDITYSPVDAADAASPRPTMTGLLYPALNMAADPRYGHILVGQHASDETIARQLPIGLVKAGEAPPTIIFHAADDPTVPYATSVEMFNALQHARIFSELHIFAEGKHGFGTRFAGGITPKAWPALFLDFAARAGLYDPAPAFGADLPG